MSESIKMISINLVDYRRVLGFLIISFTYPLKQKDC